MRHSVNIVSDRSLVQSVSVDCITGLHSCKAVLVRGYFYVVAMYLIHSNIQCLALYNEPQDTF